jgi:hypothetical protein
MNERYGDDRRPVVCLSLCFWPLSTDSMMVNYPNTSEKYICLFLSLVLVAPRSCHAAPKSSNIFSKLKTTFCFVFLVPQTDTGRPKRCPQQQRGVLLQTSFSKYHFLSYELKFREMTPGTRPIGSEAILCYLQVLGRYQHALAPQSC